MLLPFTSIHSPKEASSPCACFSYTSNHATCVRRSFLTLFNSHGPTPAKSASAKYKLNTSHPFSLPWLLHKNYGKLWPKCCRFYSAIALPRRGRTADARESQCSERHESICIASPWKRCHRAARWHPSRYFLDRSLEWKEVRRASKRPIRHTTATYQTWQCAEKIPSTPEQEANLAILSALSGREGNASLHLPPDWVRNDRSGWEHRGKPPTYPRNILWPALLTAVQHMTQCLCSLMTKAFTDFPDPSHAVPRPCTISVLCVDFISYLIFQTTNERCETSCASSNHKTVQQQSNSLALCWTRDLLHAVAYRTKNTPWNII